MSVVFLSEKWSESYNLMIGFLEMLSSRARWKKNRSFEFVSCGVSKEYECREKTFKI